MKNMKNITKRMEKIKKYMRFMMQLKVKKKKHV